MAGNIFATGMDAFDKGFQQVQGVRDQRTRAQAGRRFAIGDRAGAAQAFAEGGMIDQARTLQADQQQEDRLAQSDQIAATQRSLETLKTVAQGLKGVPAGQRKAELDRLAPVFGGLGVDPSIFQSLTEQDLSDASLDAFSGQVDQEYQAMNLGGGGVGSFNKRTGQFETIREPDPKLMTVAGGATVVNPETGQPIYTAPKAFAPPRPRSGSAKPAAFVPQPTGKRY